MSNKKEMLDFIGCNENDVLKIPKIEAKVLSIPLLERGYKVLQEKLKTKSIEEIIREIEK